jgi:hypothetical protein
MFSIQLAHMRQKCFDTAMRLKAEKFQILGKGFICKNGLVQVNFKPPYKIRLEVLKPKRKTNFCVLNLDFQKTGRTVLLLKHAVLLLVVAKMLKFATDFATKRSIFAMDVEAFVDMHNVYQFRFRQKFNKNILCNH